MRAFKSLGLAVALLLAFAVPGYSQASGTVAGSGYISSADYVPSQAATTDFNMDILVSVYNPNDNDPITYQWVVEAPAPTLWLGIVTSWDPSADNPSCVRCNDVSTPVTVEPGAAYTFSLRTILTSSYGSNWDLGLNNPGILITTTAAWSTQGNLPLSVSAVAVLRDFNNVIHLETVKLTEHVD